MFLGSYVYIPGPLSDEKVREYCTGLLCIYHRSYVRWDSPRV